MATEADHVHVIPVPDGMDPLDAFGEIRIFGELAEGRVVQEDGMGGCWAIIECQLSAEECMGDDAWTRVVGNMMVRRQERRAPRPTAAEWWLCPNGQCPHGAILHDIEDWDDERPTCCAEGCDCGAGDGVRR